MKEDFNQKVVVITGASSGIGKALAEEAVNRGAKVAACARNIEKLKKNLSPIADEGRLLLMKTDVSKRAECNQFIQATVEQWGQIDWLINNAGMSMRAMFEDLDLSVIEKLMQVNFWGMVYMTKAALPHIKKQNGGIVGVSSVGGYRGLPGRTGYSASKHAMQGFLETLRTEMLHTGVHVMWVSPGFTASNIRNAALTDKGQSQGNTPLEEGKLMSAEEVAQHIFKAMAKRKRTIVLTSQGKQTVYMNKFFPGLMDKLVFNHFAKEPGSPLKKDK